jgi:hypothetical protein
VTTVRKVITKNGAQQIPSQIGFEDVKNSFKVDKSVCKSSKRNVALKPSGLSLDQTVTLTGAGFMNLTCPARGTRVLVRVRIQTTAGAPQRALLSISKDDAKRRPFAFLKWSPSKISDYLADGCVG